jgi:alpha,alpha-trehalase
MMNNRTTAHSCSRRVGGILALTLLFSGASVVADELPPSLLYTGLYQRVAGSEALPRMKAFADAVPRADPAAILKNYAIESPSSADALRGFVEQWFVLPSDALPKTGEQECLSLANHIAARWDGAIIEARHAPAHGSLLPMPGRYITSGGIWREQYYWNTYFLVIGMDDRYRAVKREMVDNIAYLVDRYGYAPTANRTYYLSRSQPPYFYEMAAALSPEDPDEAFARYLPQLRKEYAYWMDGASALSPGQAHRRVVRMANGALLNRYWDDRDAPRDEAATRDMKIAGRSSRPNGEVYRDIRAGAESGWDFTSRWLEDRRNMASIITTAIVPVDLNSLLFGLENAVARGCARRGDSACQALFRSHADARKAAMNQYLWNEELGLFDDYNWRTAQKRNAVTAAALSALAAGAATEAQAASTAERARSDLLARGGLMNTSIVTGEQWDAPNGFAAVQWIATVGLRRYHQNGLAREIANRWLQTVSDVYRQQGRLAEKYDVVNVAQGGGGGYPLQSGQGWTASISTALLRTFPELSEYASVTPDGCRASNASSLPASE